MRMKDLVLIAEDDSTTAALVKEFLPCFDTVVVGSAQETRKLLRHSPRKITGAVIDLGLPDVPVGFELPFVRSLAFAYPDVAIVVISGTVDYSEEDILKAGAQEFLSKPITDPKSIRVSLLKAIARQMVRHDFDPLESDLDMVKKKVERTNTWEQAAHDSNNFLNSTCPSLVQQGNG